MISVLMPTYNQVEYLADRYSFYHMDYPVLGVRGHLDSDSQVNYQRYTEKNAKLGDIFL